MKISPNYADKISQKSWKCFLICLSVFYGAVLLADAFYLHSFQDERSFLSNTMMFLSQKTIVPFYTKYPTFYSYILTIPVGIAYLVVYIMKGFPAAGLGDPFFIEFIFQRNLMLWTWIGRILSMVCAIGILNAMVYFARKHYGWLAAVFASVCLITDPFDQYFNHARYALPDILIVLSAVGIMRLCQKSLEQKDFKYMLLAWFVAGLAMSAKFNAGVFIFPLSYALFKFGVRKNIVNVFKAVGIYLLGFFAGSPVLIIAPGIYSSGFLYEANILFDVHQNAWSFWKWLWILKSVFLLNPYYTLLGVAGVGYAVIKKTYGIDLFLWLLVPSVVILGTLEKQALHYLIFLYPFLCVYIGVFIDHVLNAFPNKSKKALTVMAVCLLLAFNPAFFQRMITGIKPNNIQTAKKWMKENISPGGVIYSDWKDVPAFHDRRILTPTKGIQTINPELLSIIDSYYRREPLYHIIGLRTHLRYSMRPKKDTNEYLVTSDTCYKDYLSGDDQDDLENYDDNGPRSRFYHELFQGKYGFKEIRRFSSGSGPVVSVFKR